MILFQYILVNQKSTVHESNIHHNILYIQSNHHPNIPHIKYHDNPNYIIAMQNNLSDNLIYITNIQAHHTTILIIHNFISQISYIIYLYFIMYNLQNIHDINQNLINIINNFILYNLIYMSFIPNQIHDIMLSIIHKQYHFNYINNNQKYYNHISNIFKDHLLMLNYNLIDIYYNQQHFIHHNFNNFIHHIFVYILNNQYSHNHYHIINNLNINVNYNVIYQMVHIPHPKTKNLNQDHIHNITNNQANMINNLIFNINLNIQIKVASLYSVLYIEYMYYQYHIIYNF